MPSDVPRRPRAWWLLFALLALCVPTGRVQTWPAFSRVLTPATFGRIDDIVAVFDFNRDGRQDLLVGGNRRFSSGCGLPDQRPLPPPLRVMLSNGDGTFRDGTAEIIERDPAAFFNPAWPVRTIGDFNNDGRDDFAVFDVGTECGSYPAHSYVGYPPILLLSVADTRWRASDALAAAVAAFHSARLPQFAGSNLRAVSASAGDINGDGWADIWIESCGGQNVCSHFAMNNRDGTFTVDTDRAPSQVLHNPPPEFWRHYGNALADLNGDQRPDLILGQTRDPDPTHINEASIVVFNDGTGRFPLANRVLLPPPSFAAGLTGVVALTALDVDTDGRRDLLLTHHRSAAEGSTGRYLQVLLNRGAGNFVDESAARFGDQSATSPGISTIYQQPLRNRVESIYVRDVDGNGTEDLVLNAYAPIGPEAPLVHFNQGNGVFVVADPNAFTNGELFFGENSVPLDLNGDAVVDFVHTDARPGPDGTYGTADDVTQFVALVASGGGPCAPPGSASPLSVSQSGSLVVLVWAPAPRATDYVIEVGSAPGLSNILVAPLGTATSFTAVAPPGRYHARIRGRSQCGLGPPSNEIVVIVD